MKKEIELLYKMVETHGQWITTKQLDAMLLEFWGDDWCMACNSMMRRGLIDYQCDGDWEILFTKEDLDDEMLRMREEQED